MSKLEELIKKLCPNGVEYRTLGTLGEFYGGLSGKNKNDFNNGNAKYITYMNIYKNIKVNKNDLEKVKINKGEKQNKVEYGDVLFTGSSENLEECGLSSVFADNIDDDIYLNSFCFGLKFYNREMFNPEFLKYLFRSHKLRKKIIKTASGVTRFNVSKKKMENVSIPVPPIEVQNEIVRILDKFTELEEELEEELEARKKQYEYYSEELLSDSSENKYVSLGSLTKVITKGTTPSKFQRDGVNFIKTEAFDGTTINKSKLTYISEEIHNTKLKRSILVENDILFTIAGATIGKMAIVTKDILPANTNQALAIIRLNENVNIKYIKYILQSSYMKKYIKKCVKGSAQPNLNLQQLNEFSVPYPSNEKQIKIANMLEKFEKISSDISEGLPAEIEARRKQYEYYRDKLLTFKEIKNG